MITLNNLTMGFTGRTLFKDVSLSIFPNEKIGLTGPNGAGKTTLFSIILGDMEPVAGSVQKQKNLNIGYLPQESHFHSDLTVMDEVTSGDSRIKALKEEKQKLEDSMKADSPRYGDILHELESLGIYDLEHRAERILMGLGFKEADFHRPIVHLSGGWQMRTLLAKLLTYQYDLLLLDEPTNYLDLEATLWLKGFLASYNGAFVLISHDRIFLNDVTNYTVILEGSQMTKIKGNFAAYEEQREQSLKSMEKKHKVIEKKRQQLERFTERFHAQPNRASAVRNKRKMIERLEKIEIPTESSSISEFEFSHVPASGYLVAQLTKINKSYGDKQVYHDLNLEITKGQKICLVGPNGAGKSTLLKMLAEAIKPDSGTLKYGHNVKVGYYSQSRLDVLNPNRNAFEEVINSADPGTPAVKARSLLGLFNFRGDDVFKAVKILSGGEKSRLILAKLLINPPNFMLLDEPTTHLDLDGVNALIIACKAYPGTLCFISHHLHFIKEIADHIVDVNGGVTRGYPGGLEYYLEKKSEQNAVEQKIKQKEDNRKNEHKESAGAKDKSHAHRASDPLHAKHQEALKRIAQIKNEIKSLEQEKKDLETENYVKSRTMQKTYESRDAQLIKELGKRLKDIQSRLREIDVKLAELDAEKKRINK